MQRSCRRIDLPAKAFKSGLPSLAKMGSEFGAEQVEDLIKLWIIDMTEFINIGKSMSPTQIENTAFLIVSEFYHLNMADINLVFRRAKTGYYGEIYDRLDGQVILGWFKKYNQERCLAAEEESINKAWSQMDDDNRVGRIENISKYENKRPTRNK